MKTNLLDMYIKKVFKNLGEKHPVLAFSLVIMGLPVFVLFGLTASVAALSFPLALLCGFI